MTDRELMQQALEALNRSDYLGWQLNIPIIKALRERLAQPEHHDPIGDAQDKLIAEQVASQDYRTRYDRGCYKCGSHYCPADCPMPTHLAPQQPQMQPCAGRNCGSTNPNLHSAECFEDYEKATGMAREHVIDCPRCGHCCPQSSQAWNELTDEEMKSIQMQSWNNYPEQQVSKFDAWKCQRLTQARLKEKNT